MSYKFTTNTLTPVTVDGQWGPKTTGALQYGLLVETTQVFGPYTTRQFQTLLQVTADGVFGPASIKALEAWLDTPFTGSAALSELQGTATVFALQAALNAGTLSTKATTAASTGVAPIAESAVTYGQYTGSGTVAGWISTAMAIAGVSGSDWESGLELIVSHESGGNPNAVNDYDLNNNGPVQADGYDQNCSRGVAQCIPPTFAAHHGAGTSNDIYDPVSNLVAAIFYIIATYGSIDNVPGVIAVRGGGTYQGY